VRQRAARTVIAAGLVMLLVVVLASTPSMRNGAAELARSFLPTPAPTPAPGANQFYFLPSPPGVVVRLDGHVLDNPPMPGDRRPLVLSPGRHTIAWDSSWFPFLAQQCVITVPESAHPPANACPLGPLTQPPGNPLVTPPPGAPLIKSTPVGNIITLHSSLTALPAGQAQDLMAEIQGALDATPLTTTVQVGERFAHDPPPRVAVATEPLRATLRYTGQPAAFYPETCAIITIVACRFPAQQCALICTAPASQAAGLGGARDWIAGVGVRPEWSYTTRSGGIVELNVGGTDGWELVILRISWDGAYWHVTPIFGHTALPATDDAACDAALAQLTATTWFFMVSSPPPGASLAVASDASPVDGCVVVMNHGEPRPVFLERFGVLLTVNDQAINPQDGLPKATAAEQQLAQRLMAQLRL
jgi:hypothetical protein